MRRSTRPRIVGRYKGHCSKTPYERVYKTARGALYVDKKAGIRKHKRYIRQPYKKYVKQ
jgi:hypothetical protein